MLIITEIQALKFLLEILECDRELYSIGLLKTIEKKLESKIWKMSCVNYKAIIYLKLFLSIEENNFLAFCLIF